MTDLPQGWCLAAIADTGKYINGFAFKPQHWGDAGRPIIRIQNLTGNEREINRTTFVPGDEFIVQAGDILVSWSATLDAFIWDREESLLNQHIFRVIPESRVVTKKYLFYLLKKSVRDMQKTEHLHGSTMKHINRGPFMAYKVPIAPYSEQSRIVDEIEKQFTRIDDAVAALKRVQANLKRYRASVLKAACEGRLVPAEAELARKEGRSYEPASELLKRILAERRATWEAQQLQKMIAADKPPRSDDWKKKYQAPRPAEARGLAKLPEGWIWASVQQIGEVQLGRQRSPAKRSKDYPTKYIRAANITERGLDLSDILEMEFEPVERTRFQLKCGDLVLSEASGSPAQVGKPAIWRDEIPDCCFQNTVIRLSSALPASEYLLVCFQNHYTNGFFSRIAGGVGINHLGAEKFADVPVPIPPVQEQNCIVAAVARHLSVIEGLDRQLRNNLARCTAFKRSVLSKAFSGKLVPQDPNDEPASGLLERICNERVTTSAKKNGNQQAATEAKAIKKQRWRHSKKLAQRDKVGKALP